MKKLKPGIVAVAMFILHSAFIVNHCLAFSPDIISFNSNFASAGTLRTVSGIYLGNLSEITPGGVTSIIDSYITNPYGNSKVFNCVTTNSTVVHSIASGNWSNPNTWSTGSVPNFNSTVSIDSLYTVHLDNATDSCFNLIVNHGATLDATGLTGVLNIQNTYTHYP